MRQQTEYDRARQSNGHAPVEFGEFQFDLQSLELSRGGVRVPLELQPAKVLAILLRARGSLVTREELVQAVWGERFLAHDQSINYCIRQIRSALGDDAADPRFVRTLPRRGYRFVTEITPAGLVARGTSGRRGSRRFVLLSLVIACTAAAAVAAQHFVGDSARPTGPGWRDDHAVAAQLSERAAVQYLTATRWMATRKHPGYDVVVAVLDSVLADHPGVEPVIVRRAEALLWSGRTTEARHLLDSLIRETPDLGQAHTLRGALALFRDGDPAAAQAGFARGVQLAPWSSEAHHYAAYGALFRRDSVGVRREISRALELDPLSPTLDGDAGMVFYYLGDLPTADSLCARAEGVDASLRAPALCRLLVAAASRDTAALVRAAVRLARLDGAPRTPSVVEGRVPDAQELTTLSGWELEQATVGGIGPRRSLLMRFRWTVLAGDTSAASALAREAATSSDPSRVFLPLDPLLRALTSGH